MLVIFHWLTSSSGICPIPSTALSSLPGSSAQTLDLEANLLPPLHTQSVDSSAGMPARMHSGLLLHHVVIFQRFEFSLVLILVRHCLPSSFLYVSWLMQNSGDPQFRCSLMLRWRRRWETRTGTQGIWYDINSHWILRCHQFTTVGEWEDWLRLLQDGSCP